MPAPTVSSILPASGPLGGGLTVTITGDNFTGTPGVTIGGGVATDVTVLDANTLTCTTPAHAAGTASVVVTVSGGGGGTSAPFNYFTYVAAPTITSLSPTTGSSAGGTSVTITGSNLSGATGVTFRGVAATVLTVSGTSITCLTPAVSVGTASVVVTTAGGSNATNSLFTYVPPPPTVTSTTANGQYPESPPSPDSLVGLGSTLGGTFLTIHGTHFTGAGGVTIGGVPATNVTVVNATTITCITPAGSVGLAPVVVTTPGGTNADNDLFYYAAKRPTIDHHSAEDPEDADIPDITPLIGTSAGGTSVTITGNYFTGTTSVTFGGVAATRVVVINDNTLTCITPPGTAGTTAAVVITTGNGGIDEGDAVSLFSYVLALPTISSVSPPIGAAAGGTSVTITGTYFDDAMLVTFGGVAATGFTVVNGTTINCTTPAGIAGTANVLVTTTVGTSADNSLYLYVVAAPTDTYIYLKGGRGDGFVPKWTGALSEEGLVSESGASVGTAGREVSEPYRDIFPSSSVTQTFGSYQFYLSQIPYITGGTAESFYPDEQGTVANTGKGRISDEVAHVKPRQFTRVSTWLIFTSGNGLPYKFRKDLVLGWGAQPRSE